MPEADGAVKRSTGPLDEAGNNEDIQLSRDICDPRHLGSRHCNGVFVVPDELMPPLEGASPDARAKVAEFGIACRTESQLRVPSHVRSDVLEDAHRR